MPSLEKPPVSPKPSSQPESGGGARINFSPQHFFEKELDVAHSIAELKAGASESLTPESFRVFVGTLDRLRAGYLRVAEQQAEPPQVHDLVNAGFHNMMANEWAAHPQFENRATRTVSEKLKHAIWWQTYSAQYLTRLNERFDERQAIQQAVEFWRYQERTRRGLPAREQVVPFEQLKNGVLRMVALQHILEKDNGWKVRIDEDPTTDAVSKIDLIAESPEGITFLIQIKEANQREQELLNNGYAITEVGTWGSDEIGYLGEFQEGIKRYIKDHQLSPTQVHGVFVELSAGQQFINRETGKPKPVLAQEVGQEFKLLNKQDSGAAELLSA